MKSFLSSYNVNSVPLRWRLLYWIYGYGLGFLTILFFILLRLTIRVRYENRERLLAERNSIQCLWHDRVMAYMIAEIFRSHRGHAWLNHAKAYMKPIHVVISFLGVEKLLLGSSGHDGRTAADGVLSFLVKGYSTILNPDGPYGPKYECKKGALHLALQSGVGILPIKITVHPYWRWPGWDRKHVPIPFFSSIVIRYGEIIRVKSMNFEEERCLLAEAMG